MRFFRAASSYRGLREDAEEALRMVRLDTRAADAARTLSHGERRQLEIAMTLATKPDLLLLDELLAGTGAEEAAVMIGLLRRLGEDHAVILVEHDMDAVFELARSISVMVDGAIIASGDPARIRADPLVQEAYLGATETPQRTFADGS
ncbi:MAG TPA: ATP-binding cassette domain-containing protein [Stellaceae bacterium]|nr:ATP-binding cassette domain-containing protein [Stellaceae bacterium]